ncbi:amidohydrolase family protein [Iocasia frigidifontis]|uniref:Amidohydrolase family protein n=1 Tax=Iocasia fonsfrigidae TaxID=2682810 RepID=A0A8A7K724_9FIRM|nr:D-aminoacylase [Iocasia fonsfrigidae]QTL97516.1 amidohydrolase family protein [Iocasia fonsfrigidae]
MLIKNALLIDGTGKERFKADLLIEKDGIKEIKQEISTNDKTIINAEGYIVCPGFIDTHSHSDLKLFDDPYVEPKIRQGITTEILGQDGVSVAPLLPEYLGVWQKNLAGLDGVIKSMDWEWQTVADYFHLLAKKKIAPNIAYLVPHGNVRMEVMGLENRKATLAELEDMKVVIRREMEAGAIGFSTGLIYPPCAYADTEELLALCKVVKDCDGVFVVHQRSEADQIIDSMKEIILIAKKTGVKIHFSHFKICGRNNWNKIDQVEELLDEAGKYTQVSFDQYPYIAGSTMLSVILPPWVHDGGTEMAIERLKDESVRKRIISDIENGLPGWDNFIEFAGFDGIYITDTRTEKNSKYIGKNLLEIAELRKQKPFEAVFDFLIEEEIAVGMYDYYGREEDVVRLMCRPEQNVCTDGLLGGKPHPRVYGTYPRILGRYVREKGVISLEKAIYKMSCKPAQVFNLKDRGLIEEGKKADLLIFDENKIIDKATFTEPCQFPEGIQFVIVNGQIVISKGIKHNIRPGEIIKRG